MVVCTMVIVQSGAVIQELLPQLVDVREIILEIRGNVAVYDHTNIDVQVLIWHVLDVIVYVLIEKEMYEVVLLMMIQVTLRLFQMNDHDMINL